MQYCDILACVWGKKEDYGLVDEEILQENTFMQVKAACPCYVLFVNLLVQMQYTHGYFFANFYFGFVCVFRNLVVVILVHYKSTSRLLK